MYVHIGGSYQIPDRLILAILDLDQPHSCEEGSINHKLLQNAEREQRLEWVNWEIPRSLVVTVERLYLSPISAATLRKRILEPWQGENEAWQKKNTI